MIRVRVVVLLAPSVFGCGAAAPVAADGDASPASAVADGGAASDDEDDDDDDGRGAVADAGAAVDDGECVLLADAGADDATVDGGAAADDDGPVDAGAADEEVVPADAGPQPPPRFWWSTEVYAPSESPNPIWGDGHVHSDYSGDGNHGVRAMIDRAHALGADFVWITDHGRTPNDPGGIKEFEFDACSDVASERTSAAQFAGCGVEYRLGYTRPNGTKVYEAWHQIVQGIRKDQFGETLSSNGYTSWSAYQDDLASQDDAYATITHPSGPTAWYDDDDDAFRDADPAHHPDVELCELNGGDDDAANGNNRVDGLHAYFRLLQDGWQVSPVWNSDMHHFYAGAEKAKGYGAWIDAAQWGVGAHRAVLREAARRHRTFANHPGDERNFIRMVSLVDGAPEAMMGSTLPPRASLTLRIRANISDGQKRWRFRLYTNEHRAFGEPYRSAGFADTTVVADGAAQQWDVTFPTDGVRWVVAYASPDTGAPGATTQYVVSAPLWLNDR